MAELRGPTGRQGGVESKGHLILEERRKLVIGETTPWNPAQRGSSQRPNAEAGTQAEAAMTDTKKNPKESER